MCGRYAIDDETAREIEKLIREVDAALKQEHLQLQPFKAGDIHLTDHAPVLFMAGCYNHYKDGDRFVILTTEANASMSPVHDRMPLIIDREEVRKWLYAPGEA